MYRIEIATRVPRKFRFPFFVKLLWLVALHYYTRLSSPPDPLPADLRSPRVLAGLKDLSSFLIEQTTRFAKGANVSNERRKIARENVPWTKVPDPVTLSREFRKVVLKARGEPLDTECFLPHVAHVDDSAAPNGAGTKRKADSLEPDAHAALAAKTKARRISNGAPYSSANGGGGDGEIIGRQTIPVVSVSRREERIDPRGSAKKGALLADIRESRSTQSVVRRWDHDPLDPNGVGGPVVETRTVITIVERVKFPPAGSKASQPYATPASSESYQTYGVGPPAPPSITAVPGSAAAMTHHPANLLAQNPAPYSPYGWPFQYVQCDPNGYALGTAPPPQYQYSTANVQTHHYASHAPHSDWNLSSQGSAALLPPTPQSRPYPSHPGAPSSLPPLPALPSSSMPPPPVPFSKAPQTAAPAAQKLPPPPFSAMPGAAMLDGPRATMRQNGDAALSPVQANGAQQ